MVRLSTQGGLPIRLVLAAILGFTAWAKIKDPAEVVATIGSSGLFPSSWDRAMAYAIIVVEAALALAVIPRKSAIVGLGAYASLSSIFFGYSVWRWWQDIKAPCGCFGLLLRLEPWLGALLSSLMCGAALLALRESLRTLPPRYASLEPTSVGEPA